MAWTALITQCKTAHSEKGSRLGRKKRKIKPILQCKICFMLWSLGLAPFFCFTDEIYLSVFQFFIAFMGFLQNTFALTFLTRSPLFLFFIPTILTALDSLQISLSTLINHSITCSEGWEEMGVKLFPSYRLENWAPENVKKLAKEFADTANRVAEKITKPKSRDSGFQQRVLDSLQMTALVLSS